MPKNKMESNIWSVTDTTTFGSSVAVPADDVKYLGISFSPDSKYLYFTRREKNGPGILYQLAWPGTNPVKLKNGVDGPISFSPQGDRFAFVRHDEATSGIPPDAVEYRRNERASRC